MAGVLEQVTAGGGRVSIGGGRGEQGTMVKVEVPLSAVAGVSALVGGGGPGGSGPGGAAGPGGMPPGPPMGGPRSSGPAGVAVGAGGPDPRVLSAAEAMAAARREDPGAVAADLREGRQR